MIFNSIFLTAFNMAATFDESLQNVLQTRRYDRLMGRSRSVTQVISDFFTRILDALFERFNFNIPRGSGEYNALPLIFAIVGGILFAVGVFVLIRMILHARRPYVHNLAQIFEELADHNYTVEELINLADEAPERRVAIRYRYIAAILSLHEKNFIKILPSSTNAIILRHLKDFFSNLAKPFTEVAHIYHLAWFGYRDINDEMLHEFCKQIDDLIAAMPPPHLQPPPPPPPLNKGVSHV